MRKPRMLPAIMLMLVMPCIISCGSPKHETSDSEREILVQVCDSALTMRDVISKIPAGLDPADSARMFHNIADSWVRNLVLADVAANNIPDQEKIDKMVEQYRNSLIVNEYLSSMAEKDANDIPEARIREYYDSHRNDFVLTQPLVKGGLVQVSSDDPDLDKIRKWMAEFSDESVDKIEKSGLRHASRYEYFRNDWLEWSVIADRIPYRFGNADSFVKSNRNFETTEGASVYILHISDYQPSGTIMPYDFAKIKIREILRVEEIEEMRSRLINDIYRRKIHEGVLKPGIYNPIRS